MDNVECEGNETNILLCIHTKREDCGSAEGAGVVCEAPGRDNLKLIVNFLSLFNNIMVFLARSLAISDEDKKAKEEEDEKEEAMKKDLEEKLYFEEIGNYDSLYD